MTPLELPASLVSVPLSEPVTEAASMVPTPLFAFGAIGRFA